MIRWLLLAAAGLAAAGLLLREETGAPPAPAAAPVPGALASAGTGTLSIEVEGLEGGAGQVALALFDGAAGFESGRALSTTRLDPAAPRWTVADLPIGDYAVKAYHDVDGDGALDKGAFGIPTEPYGFSNDARGTLGPPSFAAAAVRVAAGNLTIRIRVH